jgi:DNA-binding beta-propeller fold protein YncE
VPPASDIVRQFAAWVLLGGIPAWASQEPFTEQERDPNWVAPLVQFGSWGSAEGRLLGPRAVAVSPQDKIYVADSGNHRVRIHLSDGKQVGGWGKPGSGDSEFLFPSGIAAAPAGEIIVADTGNDRLQVFDAAGKFLRHVGRVRRPWRLAAAADRIALIAQDDPRILILSPQGEIRATIGEFGDGPGQFKDPSGVAYDAEGHLYVADSGNCRIQKFDPSGKPAAEWGSWGTQAGLFGSPRGVACGPGRVYVADADNHRIQVFDPAGRFLYQWGKAPNRPFAGEGRLHAPSALAVSPSGGLTVVAEPLDHRCQVFANGSARNVTPSAELPWWDVLHAKSHPPARPIPPGTAPSVWGGRNPPLPVPVLEPEGHAVLFYDLAPFAPAFIARAGGFGRKLGEFSEPCGVVQDVARGRVYVSDRGNRRIQALELQRSDTSPTGFAPGVKVIAAFEPSARVPASVAGYDARIGVPEALALDRDGNLHVADGPNGTVLVFNPKFDFVRAMKITVDGGRTPFHPAGIAVRSDGKVLYLTNPLGFQVVAVDPQGVVLSTWGTRGAEGKSSFLEPSGIAAEDGAVFVTDALQQVVKKFDEQGAPLGEWGGYGHTPGKYASPTGILGIKANRLLVDDHGNHRVQIVRTDGRGLDLLIKGGAVPPAVPAPK